MYHQATKVCPVHGLESLGGVPVFSHFVCVFPRIYGLGKIQRPGKPHGEYCQLGIDNLVTINRNAINLCNTEATGCPAQEAEPLAQEAAPTNEPLPTVLGAHY